MVKKRSKAAKKAQKNQRIECQHLLNAPHSMIFNRGKVGDNVQELIHDMRKVMEPYTASNLKVRQKNILKDFTHIAGSLGVSHLIMFSKTDNSINLRIARTPRGPTMTFKLKEYCLRKDILASRRRPSTYEQQFKHHPLVVLNNFTGQTQHVKLMTTMFQNMFPAINVSRIRVDKIRRCVMFNYDPETQLIDFRHYTVKIAPTGLSRPVKKLLQTKFPNLENCQNIDDFLLRQTGYASESEGELDGEQGLVTLPQRVAGRGNLKSHQSAVRLIEYGPRMTLQLYKVEEKICSGEVLYHAFVEKTANEVTEMREKKKTSVSKKAERKHEQEENVKRKQQLKDEHKRKCLAGMERQAGAKSKKYAKPASAVNDGKVEDDDDAAYYRDQVGTEPDENLFPKSSAERNAKKRPMSSTKNTVDRTPWKTRKLDNKPQRRTPSPKSRGFKRPGPTNMPKGGPRTTGGSTSFPRGKGGSFPGGRGATSRRKDDRFRQGRAENFSGKNSRLPKKSVKISNIRMKLNKKHKR